MKMEDGKIIAKIVHCNHPLQFNSNIFVPILIWLEKKSKTEQI